MFLCIVSHTVLSSKGYQSTPPDSTVELISWPASVWKSEPPLRNCESGSTRMNKAVSGMETALAKSIIPKSTDHGENGLPGCWSKL